MQTNGAEHSKHGLPHRDNTVPQAVALQISRPGYKIIGNFAAPTLVEAVGLEFRLLYCPLFLLAD